MFHPTTVNSHRVRLQYSEESRDKHSEHPLRANHGSFPTFRHSSDDLAALIGDKTNKSNIQEKLAKITELPKIDTPAPLPGDCSVKDYILENVTPYNGDSSFLAPATERTLKTWKRCEELMELERQRGILDVDTKTASTITSHGPGYVLSKEEDVIYGLQTDEALKRSCKPRGGFSLVRSALESYGFEADPDMKKTYTEVSIRILRRKR
jgi:hypothetical protein